MTPCEKILKTAIEENAGGFYLSSTYHLVFISFNLFSELSKVLTFHESPIFTHL